MCSLLFSRSKFNRITVFLTVALSISEGMLRAYQCIACIYCTKIVCVNMVNTSFKVTLQTESQGMMSSYLHVFFSVNILYRTIKFTGLMLICRQIGSEPECTPSNYRTCMPFFSAESSFNTYSMPQLPRMGSTLPPISGLVASTSKL